MNRHARHPSADYNTIPEREVTYSDDEDYNTIPWHRDFDRTEELRAELFARNPQIRQTFEPMSEEGVPALGWHLQNEESAQIRAYMQLKGVHHACVHVLICSAFNEYAFSASCLFGCDTHLST